MVFEEITKNTEKFLQVSAISLKQREHILSCNLSYFFKCHVMLAELEPLCLLIPWTIYNITVIRLKRFDFLLDYYI